MPYLEIDAFGNVKDSDGGFVGGSRFDALQLCPKHLRPHFISFEMPRGDVIGVEIHYSSHCWSTSIDQPVEGINSPLIRDSNRWRIFDHERFQFSYQLPGMFQKLALNRIYWTPSDRNFAVYNATQIIDGRAYTAFFTIRKQSGSYRGQDFHVHLHVESAYCISQPSKGMKITAANAINAAMTGKKLRYRG